MVQKGLTLTELVSGSTFLFCIVADIDLRVVVECHNPKRVGDDGGVGGGSCWGRRRSGTVEIVGGVGSVQGSVRDGWYGCGSSVDIVNETVRRPQLSGR